MNLRQDFLSTVRPARDAAKAAPPGPSAALEAPPRPEALYPLVDRLFELLWEAGLPQLTEEEVARLAVFLDPELLALVNDCVGLLRRRPDLGASLSLSAESLEELVRLDLELERLQPIAADLTFGAENARDALLLGLAAQNARVLLFVTETAADATVPVVDRKRLRDQFGGALCKEEERQARHQRQGARPTAERQADALRRRIAAAAASKAVLEARRLLQAVADREDDR